MNIFVAWSRAREDCDAHTNALVHLSGAGEDDTTLCGVKITAEWEMTVWDEGNLASWVGCQRCIGLHRRKSSLLSVGKVQSC